MNLPIVLASKSPWRRRLLKKHRIPCTIHATDFHEIKKHVSPRKLAMLNAEGKARRAAPHHPGAVILGVDTVGVIGKKILGKAKNKKEAAQMLRSLSGTRHRVISGICVLNTRTGKMIKTAETTWVTFRKISAEELGRYLDSGHWKGKAGSYAIQGRAKGFVKKIEGDVTNVVGLPITTLKKMLERMDGT